MSQIVRTKRELAFTQKAAYSNKLNRDKSGKENGNDDLDRTIRQVETIEIQKKALQDENLELKSRISELE